MEKISIAQERRDAETQIPQPYHAPKLISLGEIQSIVQGGTKMGTDAGVGGPTCSVTS
jgi:hypothetical protein